MSFEKESFEKDFLLPTLSGRTSPLGLSAGVSFVSRDLFPEEGLKASKLQSLCDRYRKSLLRADMSSGQFPLDDLSSNCFMLLKNGAYFSSAGFRPTHVFVVLISNPF